MPALLTVSSVMMCPHGGSVQASTTNTRATAGGDPLVRQSDIFVIAGCPFVIGIVPSPCVQVQWIQSALRGQVESDFLLNEESVGLCLAATGAPQGAVLVASTQPQVSGI